MIDQFQIVLFLKDQPPSALELLNVAFPHVDPEEFRKMPNQGSYGLVKWDGFTVSVQCQINRVDLVVDRPADEADVSSVFIEDEDLRAAFDVAVPVLSAIAGELSVVRGAILVTKSEITESSEASFADIIRKVPGLPHPAGAADVEYRINVPIASASNSLVRYNRVARWFAAKRGILALAPQQNVTTSVLSDVSIISVDINIAADGSINSSDVDGCVSEMFELASDLLSRGMDAFQ